MSRSRILVAVAVVLAAVAVAAPLWAHGRHRAAAACPAFRAGAAQRATLVTGSGSPVLVIGDSYSVGFKVAPDESWPTRLPGRVHVDGFSGSGFSRAASPCGDVSYATRAARSVSPAYRLVVVEGGLNDTDQPDAAITAGFDRLLARLHGYDAVVVGPPSAPLRAAGALRVDRLLARLCADAHVPYVSTVGATLPYLDDRLHLTAEGHREFGDLVAAALAPPQG